jgi:DNA modification methylase
MQKIKASEIVYREDLYPRFEPNQATIQKYSDSTEHLPPIKLNQNMILIDGFHRWKAFLLAGETEIPFDVIETASEKELKRLAYQLNSNHGLQLSNDEKRRYAQEMFGEMSIKALCDTLGVSEKSILRWTETQAKAVKEERDRKIVDLYLKAWNTQQSIADILGIGVATVNELVNKFGNGQMSKSEDFKPLLYNIWNTPKQDNDRKHFGAFPEVFMENLLHYHTEPLDIVYDPFGGGGTTVDVCKRMFRRYYVSDRKVIPGRESEIIEHDIKDGLPTDLQKPKLVFLDPPYWKQAENKYSDSPDDLANMDLDNFNESMFLIFKECKKRKIQKIAIVISPNQWKNDDKRFIHHTAIFNIELAKLGYNIEMEYVLPYSTEQYNGTQVNIAKEKNICLCVTRYLTIWDLAKD